MTYIIQRLTFIGLSLLFAAQLFVAHSVAEPQCQSCHEKQVNDWRQSHHYFAMNEASAESVAGDFSNKEMPYQSGTLTLIKNDEGYWLVTKDNKGQASREKIRYTFGYYPLQQYMVADGRGGYQFIPLAWDSRAKDEGGQRWFVLHPDQQAHDEFHPSQMGQNWNHMCADCHSTDFEKNYAAKTNQFASSFSRINVSCAACHGDATSHLAWANGDSESNSKNKGFEKSLSKSVSGFEQASNGKLKPVSERQPSAQVAVCATCHSRRTQLQDRDPAASFYDTYSPALITEPLYFNDGQVRDETYVWGSFLQSKMFKAGVTCTNCHNPHSGQLVRSGNQTCTQCHATNVFDDVSHHGHTNTGPQTQCVNCHMPETTFMQVDSRRDHSFRVPRPDLTEQTGAPNACNSCHDDKSAQWATKAILSWHPDSSIIGSAHYAQTFHTSERRLPDASQLLSRIAQDNQYNDIVRASALARLAPFADNNAVVAISRAVRDDEPLKRLGAITGARGFALTDQLRLLGPLLSDSRLAIRSAAGRALAGVLTPEFKDSITAAQRKTLTSAVQDYRNTQTYQAERGSAHTNLGNLALVLNDQQQAEKHYRDAIQVEPIYMPAYINLAELLRRSQSEAKSRDVLNQALKISPNAPDIHYALAMSWIREKQRNKAREHLKIATESGAVRYLYTYGLLLNEMGEKSAATVALEKAFETDDANPELTYLLVQINLQQKHHAKALKYAKHLSALLPGNPQIKALVEKLELQRYLNNGQ
ncbi:tetratricopeptide repeat protein [Salinimonas iocasae]|uniref:Uncharacterized protein n=1 Tax=Salinimonas iocasae TaxID=2572577 RepID=A0A5B7YJT6_9ALTE|nr:tetratricopeptide repeat protein [Salinimonas iocasae]QCZ94919.1 hypothetical protein FBQ74_16210 [Salinimonas iocasae]